MTLHSKTPSVLIADDDEDLVDLLARRCESIGLRVDTANNAMTALGKIEEDEPNLILLDVNMPQGNGLSVCEMLANHEQLRSIPVVMLTGSTAQETVRRCYELCAYYVPKCSDVWGRLEPLIRELLGLENAASETTPTTPSTPTSQPTPGAPSTPDAESEAVVEAVFAVIGAEEDGGLDDAEDNAAAVVRTDQPWVLSIEDDEDVALALKLRLEEYGVTVIRAGAGAEGYRKAFFSSPRAILLDYELPSGNGDYVLRRLKETPATADIPVIVLTGRREASIERQMRNLGADEFFTKPFNWRALREALNLHLDDPALTDAGERVPTPV